MVQKSINIPAQVLGIIQKLQDEGFAAYVVGGGVRDALMGRAVEDWDICTRAKPDQILPLFSKVIPTGLKHGTLTVLTEKNLPVEVTTFRIEENYADGRHPEKVTFTDNLEKDLARRDFTMNAIAWDPIQKKIHDPFNGIKDIQNQKICSVGKALTRFQEDGLRPVRAIRFAAQLEFEVSSEILEAIPKTLEVTRKVAMERIRMEFMKMFQAPKPSIALELARKTGLLEIILPELLEGVAMEQNQYHAFDVYEHSLRSCDEAKGPPLLRLGVLLHDIGKPRTRKFLEGRYRFYAHDSVGAKMVQKITQRLRFSNADSQYLTNLVKHHMFYYREDWNDATVRRFIRKVGHENLEDLFELRVADEKASGVNAPDYVRLDELRKRIQKIHEEEQALTVKQLVINGQDVMEQLKLKPGPQIGKILKALLENVIEDPSLNTREILLERMKKFTDYDN